MQANGSSRPRINAERAYLFYPSFGIVDLRRLTVFFKFASTSVSCSALSPQNGRRNRKQASTHLLGTYAWRAASPSAGIYSLLGAIAQRIGVHVSPRARPCLRVWSIQMDCSVCRSACGLTRREKESGERGRLACVVECRALRLERPPAAGGTRGHPRHRVHTRLAYARHRVLRTRRTRDVSREARKLRWHEKKINSYLPLCRRKNPCVVFHTP